MAVAYAVVAWLLVQVSDILLPIFGAPDWLLQSVVLLLAIGFPITLLLAWFYRVSPEDISRAGLDSEDEAHEAFPGQLLNYIIMGVLAAAVVLFALDKFVWQPGLHGPAERANQSVAVLPFRNLSGDPLADPFVNGIHDDLLTQLSRISSLRTISRTSVMRYRDQDIPVPVIAEELGVSAVLEGGVQRLEDRIRVNAQLIDSKNDSHLWAETYDRKLTAANIFAIQSDIARAIADALRANLSGEEMRALSAVPTKNLAAYDAYVNARASLEGISDQNYARALEQFQFATELDSEFAAAWAGLCTTHLRMYRRDSNREHFDNAESACGRALELDNSRAEVYVALGGLYSQFGQYSKAEVALQRANLAKAEEALEQALSMEGVQVEASIELGIVLARQGRLREAESHLKRAEALEPGSWDAQNALFSFYYTYSKRPDRFDLAAQYAAKSASLRPDLAASWNNLGSANYMMGRFELAADAWEESLAIEPNRTAFTNTGHALYYSGRFEEAAQMQEKAVALSPRDHRAMGRLADALHFVSGRQEESRQAFERATALAEELLQVNDRDWRTLGLYAFYHANLGNAELARQHIDRALQLSERNAETLYYLALIQSLQGLPELAVVTLAELVEKDPDYINLISQEPYFRAVRALPEYQANFEKHGGTTQT